MSGGQIIIAALAIIGGAWLLSRYLGRERSRPAINWTFGEVVELPQGAKTTGGKRFAGGEGAKAARRYSEQSHNVSNRTGDCGASTS